MYSYIYVCYSFNIVYIYIELFFLIDEVAFYVFCVLFLIYKIPYQRN